jgi:hypothetical protein
MRRFEDVEARMQVEAVRLDVHPPRDPSTDVPLSTIVSVKMRPNKKALSRQG